MLDNLLERLADIIENARWFIRKF